MSTKISISYGKDYHLYQEIFDVSNVYLQIQAHHFEATRDGIMVQIPIEAWRAMQEDWAKRGWPKKDDHTEDSISMEWIESLERLTKNKE